MIQPYAMDDCSRLTAESGAKPSVPDISRIDYPKRSKARWGSEGEKTKTYICSLEKINFN